MRTEVQAGTFFEDGRRHAVYVDLEIRPAQMIGRGQTIDHAPIPADAVEVAITGAAYYATADGSRDRRYREGYAYGQIIDELRKVKSTRAARIAELWDSLHLNGMQALCAHQGEEWTCTRDLNDETRETVRRIGGDADSIAPNVCNTLNGWPIFRALDLRYPKRGDACHACGRNRWDEPTDACPLTGYRAGTAWLYAPVPAEALTELRHLFGKPNGWMAPPMR
jgi:hypothetical protein